MVHSAQNSGGRQVSSAEAQYSPDLEAESSDAASTVSERKPRGSGKWAEDPEGLARDTVYELLAVRDRSRSELRQALQRKGIEGELVENVLQKFVDAGLVDDAAFARTWVSSRHRHQGLGRKALGFELRRKGVDEQDIAAALSSMDDSAEAERAAELVRRKLTAMTATDDTTKKRRLLRLLTRKGYPESLSFRVVREELERAGIHAEELDSGDAAEP